MSLLRRLCAEMLGTALLLAVAVGSGVMGAALAVGNDAVALLGNTLATAAGLIVLILIFGPVSGAHFNPAVTLSFFLRREIAAKDAVLYVAAQATGGLLGVALAHAMFDLELAQAATKARAGIGQALGEAVATFGLVLTILATTKNHKEATPYAVGLWIAAGYWFTSSTSFANPAVTIARTLTDTFAGVRPDDAPPFVAAQLAAAVAATLLAGWLFESRKAPYRPAG